MTLLHKIFDQITIIMADNFNNNFSIKLMGSGPNKSQMFVYLDINYCLSVLGPDPI